MKIEELEKEVTPELEEKWGDTFDRQAMYMGNGIYKISNIHSTNTRELFLMFIAQQEFQMEFD